MDVDPKDPDNRIEDIVTDMLNDPSVDFTNALQKVGPVDRAWMEGYLLGKMSVLTSDIATVGRDLITYEDLRSVEAIEKIKLYLRLNRAAFFSCLLLTKVIEKNRGGPASEAQVWDMQARVSKIAIDWCKSHLEYSEFMEIIRAGIVALIKALNLPKA